MTLPCTTLNQGDTTGMNNMTLKNKIYIIALCVEIVADIIAIVRTVRKIRV